MSKRVQLFGAFQVGREGQPAQFLTRPTESLCAFLASRQGKQNSRADVAAAIWPEADPDKAINRLRNALAHVRQALQPWQPLIADRLTLSFVAEDSDLISAERLYRKSRIAQNSKEERDALTRLLVVIGKDFLESWREPWTESPREFWRERRIEAALRLSGIALSDEEYELAESESLRALATDDCHEEAWASYLRVMGETGRHADAIERFRSTRQRRIEEFGFDFSTELLQLVKRVAAGKLRKTCSGTHSSVAAREVMANVLDRQLKEEPETILPLFTSEAFRKEAMKDPLEAWKLLRAAVDRTEGISDVRIQAMMLAIRLADMVDEYGAAFDYGEWLVENLPEDRQEYRFATNLLGFMCFELREWDDAWRYLTQFQRLAETYGSPMDVSIAKGQIASLHWHQGDLDRAKREYYLQLVVLQQDSSHAGLHNVASLRGNIGILSTVQGNWAEAIGELSQALSLSVANNFDYVRGLVMAPLGLAKIVTGQESDGRRLAALGLAQTYRSRYRRLHQIAADYAAGALVASGYRGLGRNVLEAYTGFRTETHHARSVSEERFADWVRKESGEPEEPLRGQVSEIVALACDALESI